MLPDPPQLLLGLTWDQQIPVRGSRMVPPVHMADAVGAAIKADELNTAPDRTASMNFDALVRLVMSLVSVAS